MVQTNNIKINPSSFRDRHGFIFYHQDRILRGITSHGINHFRQVRNTGVIDALIARGYLLDEKNVCAMDFQLDDIEHIIEHPKLNLVTYPFEWTFSALKAAALLHLDIQLMALDYGVSLRDASAYNIQFVGAKPIFMDHLSFQVYQEGEYWLGHKQFVEQFLNPLLLQNYTGCPFNDLYRGSPQGISNQVLMELVPNWRKWFGPLLLQVNLPQLLQKTGKGIDLHWMKQHPLPKNRYRRLLTQLRDWIAKLKAGRSTPSQWSDYQDVKYYQSAEKDKKGEFIRDFIRSNNISTLCDMGANKGHYSELALDAGATFSVALDSDVPCLEAIYHKEQPIFPLKMDLMNMTPSMGWAGEELRCFSERLAVDGILALAITHHLALGKNVPLSQLVGWIMGLAEYGVIEFIPKCDPMSKKLLAMRDDIFDDYSLEHCLAAICQQGRILQQLQVTSSGRTLISFHRRPLT